ncbi:MAG: mechanosensitive ion channel [Deltaproteobacteria bacterium]|nr:mechanosensitive ion channel [Deltaproteobacteria bacterium]
MLAQRLKVLLAISLFLSLTLSTTTYGQKDKGPEPAAEAKKEPAAAASVAEIIPLATQLAERSAALENELSNIFTFSEAEERFEKITNETAKLSEQLQALKSSGNYGYDQLAELKGEIKRKDDSLENIIESLTQAINNIDSRKEEWSRESQRWKELRSSITKDVPLKAVAPTFAKVDKTINRTLKLIGDKLTSLLAVQQKTGAIQSGLYSLRQEIDNLQLAKRGEVWSKSADSMFSADYYSQYDAGLWGELRKGFDNVSWPGKQFLQRQGWLFILQIILSLAVTANIRRNRSLLEQDERWRFIARRPLAAGIFFGFFALILFYKTPPSTYRLALNLILIIALARLLGGFVKKVWRKRVVYVLAAFLMATWVLQTFNLPLPLFRLYVFLTALAGMILCLWRAGVSYRRKGNLLYIWALRLGGMIFLGVIIAEIGGYSSLAAHVLQASLSTTFTVLGAWMLMLMARGTLEWVIQTPPLRHIPYLQSKANVIVSRSALLTNVLIGALFTTFILVIWRVYDRPAEAIQGVFGFGFMVGSRKVTLGLILTAAAFLYGSFLTSWAVQTMLMKGVFTSRELQVGVRISIARLIHYGFVFVGFLLALVALGVQFRDITIIAGALGVGIGFGLQGIVNNFVSGLILLFERPIKVGDYIQVGEQWAEIRRIGLRATVVETLDRSEIVVPNSDLVSNQVTNWTLSSRMVRLVIPVGVEYGSDVPLVMETLKEAAMANSKVMRLPEPQVFFVNFGESSLDFELRVWLSNLDDRFTTKSQLHQEIDSRFRQAGIVIAFPQRDLHLRSVDQAAPSNLSGSSSKSDADSSS